MKTFDDIEHLGESEAQELFASGHISESLLRRYFESTSVWQRNLKNSDLRASVTEANTDAVREQVFVPMPHPKIHD